MMIRELNGKLRILAVAIAALLLIFKLGEDKKETRKESDGFQSEKFDDIW